MNCRQASFRAALALFCLLIAPLASAARVSGEGFSIELPEGWQDQRGVMGTALMARPSQATDAEGWGLDLLTVTREAHDLRRTCLEAFTQRKLGQIAYGTERFEKIEELPLELPGRRGGVATLMTLRYQQGPQELMAYVLILDAGKYFLTATLTSTPARFEFQRARLRRVVESLRSAAVATK